MKQQNVELTFHPSNKLKKFIFYTNPTLLSFLQNTDSNLCALSFLYVHLINIILTHGISQHNDKACQGHHKRHHHMGAVGNEPHQKEATATYRGHHQKRGGALGKIAQSYKGYREDGGEHDSLEEIVAQQCHQRHFA